MAQISTTTTVAPAPVSLLDWKALQAANTAPADVTEQAKARVEEARKEILATGATEIDGEVCTVVVDTKKGAKSIDKEAVIQLLLALGATTDQVESCFKYGAETKSLRVKANLKAVA